MNGDGSKPSFRERLVTGGNFRRAFASITSGIKRSPRDDLLYRERAHLHLYLGNVVQARADLDWIAHQYSTSPGRLHCDSEWNAIGVSYWMEGHRDLALAMWRYTTSSLAANRVGYSHVGGGVEAGLLLWFGAVYEHLDDDIELVRRFYEQRLVSTYWAHNLTRWPGPIVRFFLKQIDEEALLRESAAEDVAQVSKAHFAIALRLRELRRYVASRKHLRLAAPGNGPQELYEYYNVWTYFLARFELQDVVAMTRL